MSFGGKLLVHCIQTMRFAAKVLIGAALGLALGVAGFWIGSWIRPADPWHLGAETQKLIQSNTPGTKMIHRPKSGCPAEWAEVPKMFQEQDGSYQAGCQRQIGPLDGHGETDYLLPGEGSSIVVPLTLDEPGSPGRKL